MAERHTVRSEVVLWPGAQGAWHFAYIDPLKAKVRRAEGIQAGDAITFILTVLI